MKIMLYQSRAVQLAYDFAAGNGLVVKCSTSSVLLSYVLDVHQMTEKLTLFSQFQLSLLSSSLQPDFFDKPFLGYSLHFTMLHNSTCCPSWKARTR